MPAPGGPRKRRLRRRVPRESAVGLDRHAVLLVVDGTRADLCHSSPLNEGDVTCEDAAEAGGNVSRYRVIGKLLGARMLVPWLEGRHIDSVR